MREGLTLVSFATDSMAGFGAADSVCVLVGTEPDGNLQGVPLFGRLAVQGVEKSSQEMGGYGGVFAGPVQKV